MNQLTKQNYNNRIPYPVNVIVSITQSTWSLNIKSSQRNTKCCEENVSRAVLTVQVQGVSSVKVEYDGTSSCNTYMVCIIRTYFLILSLVLNISTNSALIPRLLAWFLDILFIFLKYTDTQWSPWSSTANRLQVTVYDPGYGQVKVPVEMSKSPPSVLVQE